MEKQLSIELKGKTEFKIKVKQKNMKKKLNLFLPVVTGNKGEGYAMNKQQSQLRLLKNK